MTFRYILVYKIFETRYLDIFSLPLLDSVDMPIGGMDATLDVVIWLLTITANSILDLFNGAYYIHFYYKNSFSPTKKCESTYSGCGVMILTISCFWAKRGTTRTVTIGLATTSSSANIHLVIFSACLSIPRFTRSCKGITCLVGSSWNMCKELIYMR